MSTRAATRSLTDIKASPPQFRCVRLRSGLAGVTPTQAGRTLLQHARSILALSERLQEDLSPYARGLAGQVRVLSNTNAVSYTHLRAHETGRNLVCRLLLEKKKK